MNMNTITLASALGASLMAATAAAIPSATVQSSLGSWTSGVAGGNYIIGTGVAGPYSPGYTAYDWSGQVNVSASPNTGTVGSDGYYYAGMSLGLPTAGGVSTPVTNGSQLTLTAGSGAATFSTFTFTLNSNVQSLAFRFTGPAPAGPAWITADGTSATDSAYAISFSAGEFWFGLTSSGALNTVSITLYNGQSITLDGARFGLVPAPGALALLGGAALVSARRRRS